MKHLMALFSRGLPATALAFSLGMAGPAFAEDTTSGDAAVPDDGQAVEVSEQKLDQFVGAYGDIQSVRAEYVPKLQQAESEDEQAALQQEGQQEMVEAIESNGLDVAEYQQIGQQLNNDEELQSRLQEKMEQQGQDTQGTMQ